MTRSLREQAIGVFDSGVGGLTVLRALEQTLPHESAVYLGDTARVPYGTRSAHAVVRYALNNARTLIDKEPLKALVVACNTASAVALEPLRAVLPIPVLGVIEPGARAALAATKGGTIVVLGTAGTVRSRAYPAALDALGHTGGVVARACPLLVPLVEEGWIEGEIPERIIAKYLTDVGLGGARGTEDTNIDTLVLGCTHYPLLRPAIERVLATFGRSDITVVDGGEATARELAALLDVEDLRSEKNTPRRRTLVTDAPEQMADLSRTFLGRSLTQADVELVDVLMTDIPADIEAATSESHPPAYAGKATASTSASLDATDGG